MAIMDEIHRLDRMRDSETDGQVGHGIDRQVDEIHRLDRLRDLQTDG